MQTINVLQFLPYFPPHKGGLETHAEQWAKYWKKEGYGEVFNIVTHFNQELSFGKTIIFEGKEIGYIKDGIEILIIPSFEVISNYPIYKTWSQEYKLIKKYLQAKNIDKVITRTRFFLTSLIGGLYAKKNNISWCHIEHGSDYVKLNSRLKNFIAYMYDKIFGKYIFKNSDILVGVSEACKKFIQNEFVKREVSVIYRGVEIEGRQYHEKIGNISIVFIGRLVTLKGVEDLIAAVEKLSFDMSVNIIGDGEERNNLEKQAKKSGKNINFLGFQNKDFILDYLYKNKCIFVNTSYQEGLPTAVIEGLYTGNVVVASNVGGTKEISNSEDLLLFKAGDIDGLVEKLEDAFNSYDTYVGKSYDYVRSEFSWEENIRKYNKLFY